MQLNAKEMYRVAQDLHYNKKETLTAYHIYEEILSNYPSSTEAGYSKTQIENIEKANPLINTLISSEVIEKTKSILDAGILPVKRPTSSNDDNFDYEREKEIEDIIMTTTNHIEGYKVEKYFAIDSVEIVLGAGILSDIASSFTDVLGLRSNLFEDKMQGSKNIAIYLMKEKAYMQGGNAIIGVDLDYTEFSNNRMGLIISGTIVRIKPIPEQIIK